MRTHEEITDEIKATKLKLESLYKELGGWQDNWENEHKKKHDACKEHEYIHTNAKWASFNQMQCIHCGKIIN